MSDEHPLDEPLGVLHEAAIRLAMMGHEEVGIAVRLAEAHEKIQNYLVKHDL